MPTQAAQDIVNALFAGQKDLSDYVATGMNAAAVKAVDDKKQDVGKAMFAPQEEGPEKYRATRRCRSTCCTNTRGNPR